MDDSFVRKSSFFKLFAVFIVIQKFFSKPSRIATLKQGRMLSSHIKTRLFETSGLQRTSFDDEVYDFNSRSAYHIKSWTDRFWIFSIIATILRWFYFPVYCHSLNTSVVHHNDRYTHTVLNRVKSLNTPTPLKNVDEMDVKSTTVMFTMAYVISFTFFYFPPPHSYRYKRRSKHRTIITYY